MFFQLDQVSSAVRSLGQRCASTMIEQTVALPQSSLKTARRILMTRFV
jgi:hypothetical protein